jgi:flagellar basal-body rod modification protein FlgD
VYISGYPEISQGQKGTGQSMLEKDQFLKLLTIEMQHQDFFNPQDNNQFMAQVMDMSMVEQMHNIAQTLTNLFESEQQFQSIAFLGKTVQIVHEDNTKTTGVVTSVKFTAEGPKLHVEGGDYSLTQIEEIQMEEDVNSDG